MAQERKYQVVVVKDNYDNVLCVAKVKSMTNQEIVDLVNESKMTWEQHRQREMDLIKKVQYLEEEIRKIKGE